MKNTTKMKRQILCAALALMLMLSLVPTAAAANETFSVEGMNSQSTFSPAYALKNDGSFWTWGYFATGRYTPAQENVSNLKAVEGPYRLLQNGEVWQFLDMDSDYWFMDAPIEITPKKVMSNVSELRQCQYGKGTPSFVALKTDGTLVGWGSESSLTGEYGSGINEIATANAITLLTDVKHVETCYNGWMALKNDGSLWSAGYCMYGTLAPNSTETVTGERVKKGKIMDNVAAISLAHSNALIIKTDKSLWSWGDNSYAQLGNGGAYSHDVVGSRWETKPTKILDDVIFARAGATAFAVKSDGTLYGWGINSYSQLGFTGGNYTPPYRTEPTFQSTPVKVAENVAMAMGNDWTSVIVKRDGSLWTAGRNEYGDTGHSTSKYPGNVTTFTKLLDNVAFPDGMVTSGTKPTTPAASEIKVLLNGSPVTFDQAPIIENGRTLVPMRAIFEAMGATVEWNGATQTVTGTKGSIVVKMTIGNSVMTVNGRAVTLDVAPKIVGDRTLVPVRAVAESFDAEVGWDGPTQTVIITTTGTDSSLVTEITPADSIDDYRQQVFELTNEERAKVGAAALKYNSDLSIIAQARAEAMAELGYLPADHVIPGMGGVNASLNAYKFKCSYAGENITFASTPSGAISNWLNSPGHKSNMLGQLKVGSVACTWTDIGVGCAQGANGVYYWVQIFVQ